MGDRYADFVSEFSRRLKLSAKMQLMVALSLAESCPDSAKTDCKCEMTVKNAPNSLFFQKAMQS